MMAAVNGISWPAQKRPAAEKVGCNVLYLPPLQVHGCVESSHSLAWKTPFRSASRRTRSTNYLFCGGEFSRSAVMDGIRE